MQNLIDMLIRQGQRPVTSKRPALWLTMPAMLALLLVGCGGDAVKNAAPVVEELSATVDEDNSIDITLLASDKEGDDLVFSLDADAAKGSVTLDGDIATYSPNENYNGSDSFSFSVSDGKLSTSSTVSLSITAVNDMPMLSAIEPISFAEDGLGSITLSANDVDNNSNDLTYSMSEGTNITATVDGTTVNFTATENFNGSESFIATVSDGDLTSSRNFTVIVNAVNDAPSITSTGETSVDEDALYSYSIITSDDDSDSGDAWSITSTSVSWLTLTDVGDGTATLTGTPLDADVGDHSVTITVADAAGATGTQTFTITVANVNDAPSITSTGEISVDEDSVYTYLITTSDDDSDSGDAWSITSTSVSWLTLTDGDDGTATLTGTPLDADVGDHSVTITVADTAGATGTQTFTITVANVNDAPTAIDLDISQLFDRYDTYVGEISGIDPDGDDLTYSICPLNGDNAGAWFFMLGQGDENNILYLNTDNGFNASNVAGLTLEFVLLATDPSGDSLSQEFGFFF